MKVLFQSRVDLYNPRGGDTAQMEHTKAAIEKIDTSIQIDIKPEVEVPDINNYDIVHLFNIDWIAETYSQARWAYLHNKKIVLSAIHHSEQEVIEYEKNAAYDIRRIYNAIFPSQAARDIGKNFYRSFAHPKKFIPTLSQMFNGMRNQQRDVLKMADIVLVQTEKEAEDIEKDFGFRDFKWKKIVNGVDLEVFENASKEKFNSLVKGKTNIDITDKKIILSVGRIEPRKNQLALIKVFNELASDKKVDDYVLVFIGATTKNSFEYIEKFNNAIKDNAQIIYMGAQPQEMVASAMSHEGIYVHTSWFETTGLVTLEAAYSGMSVIATGERTQEYLGNSAYYCEPDDLGSIKNAIMNAIFEPKKLHEIRNEIKTQYSWENTAKQTIEVYKSLIS